jgi:hypothetical protein
MSADRAATILARFNAAHHRLIEILRQLEAPGAHGRPVNGWSPAQVGCHVALTNEWIAGVLKGDVPSARQVPEGFVEEFDASRLPSAIQTVPALEPPIVSSLEAAVDRLRTSGHELSKAIASLSHERGTGYCVTLPFGTLSLFELADFAASHVTRHIGQIERSVAHA